MNTHKETITIFGLGYVGLPLSLSYAMKGFRVYGIDISKKLVNNLKRGITNHFESYKGNSIKTILKDTLKSGNFIPCTDAHEALKNSNRFIVTVGIPVESGKLNTNPLKSAIKTISQGIKKGDCIIIRSTVVPGYTEEIIIPLLEKSGLKAGKDFNVVYCPERISEGNAFEEFENLPVIVSGINKESIDMGIKTIKMISNVQPEIVSSIKTAETAKVVENIQRDVNIAVVHQFADFCRKLGINIFELVKAVNTHPRVNLLVPAPGVGGYCIPNALYYLKPKASEIKSDTSLLELSREINDSIPVKIAEAVKKEVEQRGKKAENSKIAVLGLAMKDFCSDNRQSPVIDIVKLLQNSGLSVCAYDPCIVADYPFKTPQLENCLQNADCLLITGLQHQIPYNDFTLYKSLLKKGAFIFDTRNIIDREKAAKSGFEVITW